MELVGDVGAAAEAAEHFFSIILFAAKEEELKRGLEKVENVKENVAKVKKKCTKSGQKVVKMVQKWSK